MPDPARTDESHRRLAYRENLLGLFLAASLVIGIDLMTNLQPPVHDAIHYVNIAMHGIFENEQLAAPYAYRPAVPLIAGAIARVTSSTFEDAFQAVTRLSAFVLLAVTFLFARSLHSSFLKSLVVMFIVACSLFHVKYPLYFPTMVDVEAYTLIILGTWALLKKRYLICLFTCSAGLLFKEFLLIPAIMLLVILIENYLRDRSIKTLNLALVTFIVLGAVFLLPRMTFPIHVAFGSNLKFELNSHDPWTYFRFLRTSLSSPLESLRDLNIIFAMASYWLPVLLLVTPYRLRTLRKSLQENRILVIGFMSLLAILTLVGGTNIMIFVTYGLPILIMSLAAILNKVSASEIVFVLAAVFIFNRIWMPLPLISDDLGAAMDVYGGWGSRVNEATAFRSLELVCYIVTAFILRKMQSRAHSHTQSEDV